MRGDRDEHTSTRKGSQAGRMRLWVQQLLGSRLRLLQRLLTRAGHRCRRPLRH
ncbi:hypothetical protein ACFPM7_16285 [Actinokineospora guangxiensis]|uniref:Uncharacterized protein n=1 Tax=Actinokineospora guangxiensis TaxID=1490288 RepID=A0ABW0ESY8_9PSEU